MLEQTKSAEDPAVRTARRRTRPTPIRISRHADTPQRPLGVRFAGELGHVAPGLRKSRLEQRGGPIVASPPPSPRILPTRRPCVRLSTPKHAGERPAGAFVPTDSVSANAAEVKFVFCPFCEVRILRMRRNAENVNLVQPHRLYVVASASSQRAILRT